MTLKMGRGQGFTTGPEVSLLRYLTDHNLCPSATVVRVLHDGVLVEEYAVSSTFNSCWSKSDDHSYGPVDIDVTSLLGSFY